MNKNYNEKGTFAMFQKDKFNFLSIKNIDSNFNNFPLKPMVLV